MRARTWMCFVAMVVVCVPACVPDELVAITGGAAGNGAGGAPTTSSAAGSGAAGTVDTGGGGGSVGPSGGAAGSSTGTGGEGGCVNVTDCPAATACATFECKAGQCIAIHEPEGKECGAPQNPCTALVCVSGVCSLTTSPDGTKLPDPAPMDCLVPECQAAQPVDLPHDELCPDVNPTNCIVPLCSDGSGECIAEYAPVNTACRKQNGTDGVCNESGGCI